MTREAGGNSRVMKYGQYGLGPPLPNAEAFYLEAKRHSPLDDVDSDLRRVSRARHSWPPFRPAPLVRSSPAVKKTVLGSVPRIFWTKIDKQNFY